MSENALPNVIEGIVLRTFPSREADLVVRILSTHHGKVSILAKYHRGSKKKFGGGADIFDYGTFSLKFGKGSLPLLESFKSTRTYHALRNDLNKIGVASLLCEACDHLTPDGGHQNDGDFEILAEGLAALEIPSALGEILAIAYQFTAKLLEKSGFLDDRFNGRGTIRELKALIQHLEHCTEKPCATKPAVAAMIEQFKKLERPNRLVATTT